MKEIERMKRIRVLRRRGIITARRSDEAANRQQVIEAFLTILKRKAHLISESLQKQ